MLLSDRDILTEIRRGRVRINPFSTDLVQPASIDLRLADQFRTFNTDHTQIDLREPRDNLTSLVKTNPGEPFVLHPGQFALGSTYEYVILPDDLVGRLEGKSSLGRLGLLIHSTAGFIDPGFAGNITLELSNIQPHLSIALWPGMLIGQLGLLRMTSPALRPYGSAGLGSRYQGQTGPTPFRRSPTD